MAQVALITGAAHRVGATIARTLHGAGLNVVLHYRHSSDAASALASELNSQRADSATLVAGDLLDMAGLASLVERATNPWGRLDCLVNNASSFYATPIGTVTQAQWDDLLGTNLRAPFFLAQAAVPWLQAAAGSIINIVDIHGDRPMKDRPLYSIAKAGLIMLTKSLARELAPQIRVNGVAPGAILWPTSPVSDSYKADILNRTALKRLGSPQDIAQAVLFLARDAHYTTGHILTVDGGRSLTP